MCKQVLLGLLLAIGVSATVVWGTTNSTVYLKWTTELNPRLESGRWSTGSSRLDALLARYHFTNISRVILGCKASDPYGLKRVLRLDLNNLQDRPAILAALRHLPETVYAVENPERTTSQWLPKQPPPRQICEYPNDPLYAQQYFFPISDAPAAWNLSKGSGAVVALVDIGTDWQHPDLADNIWHNPGEIPGNGIDDDGNGYVDDVIGWDFYNNDNNPTPEIVGSSYEDHGTHTAGLVGAVMNNNRGVVGMAPSCKVMAIRAGYAGVVNYGLEGIIYAANNGADIISLSWGGMSSNSFEQDVISDAGVQGCLIVAAAGNNGSPIPNYPAAYEGVLAVGATDALDHFTTFSNYGDWVRVDAPGDAILSLGYESYVYSTGTSMSTPLVAGLAALIKSIHPTWTHEQLFSQIIFTADPLDSLNPGRAGMMGNGRINAYRAVTETAPGIRLDGVNATEVNGNMNGRLEPGETAAVTVTLTNDGAATNDVNVTLSCSNSDLQILQANWTIPQFEAGATVSNEVTPYRIFINPLTPQNQAMALKYSLSAENFYRADFSSIIWIAPNFADHNAGNVIFTVTDFGAFGYNDYMHPPHVYAGSGFHFPKTGSNSLYHGSLMAGVSYTKVSDCADGDYFSPRYDWVNNSGGGVLIQPDTSGVQMGLTSYQDTGAPTALQCSLRVTQKSYAWPNPPDDDYVIVAFEVKDIAQTNIQYNLYTGLYMDWDVADPSTNRAGWDPTHQLGYEYNPSTLSPNPRYYGISLLSGAAASYRVIDLFNDVPAQNPWMTDSLKYAFMSSGMVQTSGNTPSDYAMLLSQGPFTLFPNDSVRVAFAVLGGDNLDDLKANAAAAQLKWGTITTGTRTPTAASSFKITDVYPQPANGPFSIFFTLPGPSKVTFDLVDVLGRTTPIYEAFFPQAGPYHVLLPNHELASGVYFLRAASAYGPTAIKVVLIK